MKFTEKTVAALELPPGVNERLVTDDEMTGLGLRLRRGAKGITKSWVFRYAIAGVSRKVTFSLAGTDLKAARKRAGDLQARVRLGSDPALERAQTAADVRQTVEATLRLFLPQKRLTLRPRSYIQMERHLLTYLRPLHATPLRTVTLGEVSALYQEVAATRGRTSATNGLRSWSTFFSWCLRQGLIERNPCLGIERFPGNTRSRVLTADEIRAIWRATADASDYSAIVRLLILTGARASEVGGLKWSEVYSDRIVLPPNRTKNGRLHNLPITPAVRTILDGRERRPGNDHVFGRGDRGFTGFGSSKASLDARLKAAGAQVSGWIVHDCRRTAATGLSELGTPPHLVANVLNHISEFRHGISAVYNHATLEEPTRRALLAWDQHVRDVVVGHVRGDRVVPIVRAAG